MGSIYNPPPGFCILHRREKTIIAYSENYFTRRSDLDVGKMKNGEEEEEQRGNWGVVFASSYSMILNYATLAPK